MPPKFFQAEVLRKLRNGMAEEDVRKELKERQCPAARVSQMIKGSKDVMAAQAAAVYVEAEHIAPPDRQRPATARPMATARRRLPAPATATELQPDGPSEGEGEAETGAPATSSGGDASGEALEAFAPKRLEMAAAQENAPESAAGGAGPARRHPLISPIGTIGGRALVRSGRSGFC